MLLQTAAVVLGLTTTVNGLKVYWDDDSKSLFFLSYPPYGLMKFYTGNNTGDTPGNLPDPYYWWEAGAMFGAMIDYWWITGDETYNDVTSQAMVHQAGEDKDYMPVNQTKTEGNDDQGFWAMAVMAAAERKFPDPPDDQPQWLALTQAVFNEYASRWDTKHCGGGLRWQIFPLNRGYDYKNSISNGCFFNIAARLARYTGNETYADWATKIWDWEVDAGLINDEHHVLDGVTIRGDDCSSIDKIQWSYNAGIFLHGAAVMYNMTESKEWKNRTDGMLEDVNKRFVKNNVIYEQFCEPTEQCNQDQRSFKGYLARWLVATTQLAPYTYEPISKLLLSSAKAAAAVCSGSPASDFGGISGTACGFTWLTNAFDGRHGVGPQMNAMSVLMYTLVPNAQAPYTKKTGGSSKGDPNAGNERSDEEDKYLQPITAKDKAGAGILTVVMAAGIIGGTAFAFID
ncbi:hypothetical protein FZEAL_445 [Fusarium zealandicum]|uniref:Mannan endo-1,6-alpha-mannosidase n=1 Tax=Fusarium zealandicum TaxID=1053134 RepID=A0A8H4UVE8_9HYPO|nr:hypothetical protein FZEAL_445 [Fusarium zealandicum]